MAISLCKRSLLLLTFSVLTCCLSSSVQEDYRRYLVGVSSAVHHDENSDATGIAVDQRKLAGAVDWDAYCREEVGAASYCKTWANDPVCQGSVVKCGDGVVVTSTAPVTVTSTAPVTVTSTAPVTVTSTAPVTVTSTPNVVSTTKAGGDTTSVPTTTSGSAPSTTTSGGTVNWDAYCQKEVGPASYCKTWDNAPVCQGSTVRCGDGVVLTTTATVTTASTTRAPTTEVSSTTASTIAVTTTGTKTATTNCYESGTCVPDVQGAIDAIRSLIGNNYVDTGSDMPEVFMPQYTSITPAAVVSPGNDDEVRQVLQICFDHYVDFVVRSDEGNSFAGQSTVQDGIVIRMNRLTSVEVERSGFLSSQYVAKIGAGTRLLEAYTRLYDHNPPLSVNGGSCPGVSVSGLTQGGAYGYSSTMWGMLADHVLAVDIIVQENGGPFKLVHATTTNEHADLVKALRGGMGGNYGVVTMWYLSAIRASEKVYIYRDRLAPNTKSKADIIAKTKAYQSAMINQPSSNGLWVK
ncbi:conserved hypothetical protein [Perkinsus marinus ATCC 50983]|uniref:FAD-binding PCMH-type domain-containing protein n=1 Tax=Perkinsus marinus (strain ATCC 50983 / TXsc) TaxID=423536 RepID=C5LFR5_PERM5|nr:conserved hypothetical protein [Perkinsus marinus ATCC 50983]EER04420.1 conserved hypothetical protein [Perkinsus marinus ATCC 50983]|eukprot:XP_002772604.1 conserved hypothetical protein [Perkinsus marinus ATCC 50983]